MNGVDPAYQSLPGGGLTKKLEKEMDKKIVEALEGVSAKSAYQSYVDTTTDNPPKTEAEWVASLKGEDGVSLGEVAIADNLTTDDGTKVLSAKQGYLLGQKVNDVDDEPAAGSDNLVKSGGIVSWGEKNYGKYIENPEFVYVKPDAQDRILWAIKSDGTIYYGAGVPPQIVEYINNKIAELSLDEYEDIVSFLSDYLGSDTTLKAMIDGINAQIVTKVDKVEGNSLINTDYASSQSAIDNPEYTQVTTDSEDKILEGITSDGVKHINLPIDTPSIAVEHIENPEWSEIKTDNKQNIIEGVKKNGSKHVSQFDKETLTKLTEDLTPLLNYRKIYPHNAIVSFIDDDTGEYIPDIWGEIIEETDIKMGFACIAGFMSGEITPTNPAYIQLPLEDLRTLYNNGHEVYSHSWSHHSFRISSFEQLETECQKAKDWLDANGFTRNSDIIVYPGGMGEKKINEQTVIRRFYHYGVDTDTSDFGVNPEPVNEQCICRCNGDSLSLAELKARVDLAVERKHLLVIMCHAYELMHFEGVTPPSTSIGTKEQNIQRLIDLINYIKSLNIEILPVGEALHQIYGW